MTDQQELPTAEKLVAVVDDHNHIIDSVPRNVMREAGLCHRTVYIFVFNTRGQL